MKNKKEVKCRTISEDKFKTIEYGAYTITGIIFLVLLFLCFTNTLFIPVTLSSFALFMFCICYYYLEDEDKKKLVYTLFSLGVIAIVVEVIYTLVMII